MEDSQAPTVLGDLFYDVSTRLLRRVRDGASHPGRRSLELVD